MNSYEFAIVAGGLPIDGQDWQDHFFEAGCDDAVIALQRGLFVLHFDRDADTAEEAITLFRLTREATGIDLIKLEVIGDTQKTLYPDVLETIKACEVLAKDGFTIMAYTSDDPIMARRLEDAGAHAIMPLAAPIGSGLGVQNRYNIVFVREAVKVPIIVDAGIGCASDAALAMELGADGVLTNTAIAQAQNPMLMAEAMKNAVIAGRLSYLAGRIPKRPYATASSPIDGMIQF